MTKKGKLYGVGVGPGDPELMTIKAAKTILNCDVIAAVGHKPEESVAYRIARAAIGPELDDKELAGLPAPMTKNEEELNKAHREAVKIIEKLLAEGKNVAFAVLGDVTVYSTYMYIHEETGKAGYETEIINGITSFCAASARLNTSLVEKKEPLHIIPASYRIDEIEEALNLAGTKVFMKMGREMPRVKKVLAESGQDIVMIENCGMEGEKIHRRAEDIPDRASYYSLIIVKER